MHAAKLIRLYDIQLALDVCFQDARKLNTVNSYKYLGLWIDYNVKWDKHI